MTPKDILRTDVQVETTLGWLKTDLLVYQGKDKVVQWDRNGTYLVTHVNCKADKPPLLDIFQSTETAEGIDPDTPRTPRANGTFFSLSNREMEVN